MARRRSAPSPADAHDADVRVTVTRTTNEQLRVALTAGSPASQGVEWLALRDRAARLMHPAGQATLLAPDALRDRITPLPHQLRVAQRVLSEMGPGAILADEVGLGKTVESGFIFKELALRGLVSRVLIVCPKALLAQWQLAMREYFDEEFLIADQPEFQGYDRHERIICSLPALVRSFAQIGCRAYDLVIVDEAHLLANVATKRRACVAALATRRLLLLTATPLANRVADLFSLMDLVRPGSLGTLQDFEDRFIADPGMGRRVKASALGALREATDAVMCRTRRTEAGVELPHRFVETRVARPDEEESRLVADITDYLRILFRKGKADKTNRAALIREILAVQQSLSSSPRAAAQSLRARAERHPSEREKLLALATRSDAAASAKDNELLGIVAAHPHEPILIYAQRLETIAHVRELLRRVGRSAEAYTGALSRQEREALVDRFTRGKLDALIATDAGAEGLNLQERCSLLVNWDLPLNPTRVEQRIGRLHRIGQRRDVKVFNLVLKESVDEYVLRLLFDKMALFTATVGEVDDVIADMAEGEDDMEERLVEIWLDTTTTAAIARIEALSDEVAESRGRVTLASRMTAEVLG